MTRPNLLTDNLYAARMLRDLEDQSFPCSRLGSLILVAYTALLGLFWYWVMR